MADYFTPTSAPLEKRLILRKIVQSVYHQHGRFLKRDGTGVWVPISKEEAALKTAMALQYRARKKLSPTSGPQTCAVPVPHTWNQSKCSPARPFDIYAPHLTLRDIHIFLSVPVQRPAVLVPCPIRIFSRSPSHFYLPGPITLERYPSYRYQANHQQYFTERHAARHSMPPRIGSTRFLESCAHPQQGTVNRSMGLHESDWVQCVQSATRHFSSHEDAVWQSTLIPQPFLSSISESFWEPLPLPDNHHSANTGQSLVHDPNDLLSEWSDSTFNLSLDAVDEPLDLSQLLDLDW
jgi:hypothetical protein